MIPTPRRSRDDVFLICEESLLTVQEPGPGTDPTFTTRDGVPLARRPGSPHLPGSLHGARGIALAGLVAGVAALLAALELGGGEGPARPTQTSPPRSPLISRSATTLPARPTTREHHPDTRPAEMHRPGVVHHHRPRHAGHQAPEPAPVTEEEPEREPTPQVAPVSSPAVTEAQPTPAPEHQAPAAATDPTPPAPPPSSSGGGPAGVESFGFER